MLAVNNTLHVMGGLCTLQPCCLYIFNDRSERMSSNESVFLPLSTQSPEGQPFTDEYRRGRVYVASRAALCAAAVLIAADAPTIVTGLEEMANAVPGIHFDIGSQGVPDDYDLSCDPSH
jgi:hypothetical protein